MTTNRQFVERVYEFTQALRRKSPMLVPHLNNAIISLLEYEDSLASASRRDLMGLRGINGRNVDYLLRIFRGENVSGIADDVPYRPISRKTRSAAPGQDRGNWDGSWDNAVRSYEED